MNRQINAGFFPGAKGLLGEIDKNEGLEKFSELN